MTHASNHGGTYGGFSLPELLVTLVIIAILAAIAFPSYQNYSERSRRADGFSAIAGLQLAQERFRANCPFYAQNIGDANVCGANAGASTVAFGDASERGFYALSITDDTATGNAFTISADPQDAQAGDADCDPITLTLNPANPGGLRGPAECWN